MPSLKLYYMLDWEQLITKMLLASNIIATYIIAAYIIAFGHFSPAIYQD